MAGVSIALYQLLHFLAEYLKKKSMHLYVRNQTHLPAFLSRLIRLSHVTQHSVKVYRENSVSFPWHIADGCFSPLDISNSCFDRPRRALQSPDQDEVFPTSTLNLQPYLTKLKYLQANEENLQGNFAVICTQMCEGESHTSRKEKCRPLVKTTGEML